VSESADPVPPPAGTTYVSHIVKKSLPLGLCDGAAIVPTTTLLVTTLLLYLHTHSSLVVRRYDYSAVGGLISYPLSGDTCRNRNRRF
jgi:hypothetical protein